MSVNVNRSNKDPFYRYKMPRLISKIEGKGNGIKTVIPNMDEIARALARPPAYPTKFFGCELGAVVVMDEKVARYVVNGAHETERLADLLDIFIKKFVLCVHCGNPETVMTIDKNRDIYMACKACGTRRIVDMTHKLVTYMRNNPPNPIPVSGSKAVKKTKEERRRERNEKAKGKKTGDGDDVGDEEDDEEDDEESSENPSGASTPARATNGTSLEAGLIFTGSAIKDLDKIATSTSVSQSRQGSHGDDDDSGEFSAASLALAEAARNANKQSLTPAAKALMVDAEITLPDSYERFATFLEAPHTAEEISAQMTAMLLKEDKALAVVAQVLFNETIVTQLPAKKSVIAPLLEREQGVKGFLGGLERLLGVTHASSSKKIVTVLKWLYDEDVVGEDAIIAWFQKPNKKYADKEVAALLRQHAAPLITWLQTAEEESDEEDDE